jgi:hypothetical protein
MPDDEAEQMTRGMLEVYREAGVSDGFLEHVKATSSDSMWYPTRDQLIDAGVINRVSLGGEISTYRSRAELELVLRSDKLMSALETRYPGSLDEAVNAAWKAHQAGQTDAQVNTVTRMLLSQHYKELFQTVRDSQVVDYFQIGFAQLKAAREVSNEACALYTEARLDVAKVLPRELVQRELDWLMSALETAPAISKVGTIDEDAALGFLSPLWEEMEPHSLGVLMEPEKYKDDPGARCDASLNMFEALNRMPVAYQAKAYRTFQLLNYE